MHGDTLYGLGQLEWGSFLNPTVLFMLISLITITMGCNRLINKLGELLDRQIYGDDFGTGTGYYNPWNLHEDRETDRQVGRISSQWCEEGQGES